MLTKIQIVSVEELPTSLAGQFAWIYKVGFLGHSDFHVVLTMVGNLVILHDTQIIRL